MLAGTDDARPGPSQRERTAPIVPRRRRSTRRAGTVGPVELLERSGQLAQLADALAGAATGHGRVVVVRGDAGMGKTSLVRHFATEHARGVDVLIGGCDDISAPDPFGPVWDLADARPELLGALESDDRRGVFTQVLALLRRAVPTVLVIEDAHWADEATVDLVSHVGRRIADSHGVLIVTCRDIALAGGQPLANVVGELPRDALVRIDLTPLSEAAIAELASGSELSVSGLAELSGGNPLFITELLRTGGSHVPRTVSELTVSRIGRLTAPARELLSLVAVVPGRMEMAVLERCVGDPGHAGLDECEEHGLLDSDETTVRFRHELVRQAAEQSLPSRVRARLHRQVLEVLVAMGADPPRVLHHARCAGATQEVARYAPLAAARALSVDSYHDAVEYFRLLDPDCSQLPREERAETLLAWARAELTVGDGAAGVERTASAVAILRAQSDHLALGRALIQLSHAQWFAREGDEATKTAAEAVGVLERSPPTRELSRAYSEQGSLATMAFRFDDGVACADRAIRSAETIHDAGARAHALVTKGMAIATIQYPRGIELLEESLDLARHHGYGFHALRALISMAEVSLGHRDLERASRAIRDGLALAVERERRSLELDLRALQAHLHLLAGRFEDAAAALDAEARATRSKSQPGGHLRLLGRLQAIVGDPDASSTLSRARDEARRSGMAQQIVPTEAAALEHAWLAGIDHAVTGEILESWELATRAGHPWIAGELGYWLWKHGALDELPEWCAAPYRLQAAGRWQAAADRWQALGMRYEAAAALGEGDTDAQVEAIGMLDELGAVPLADRLRADVRAGGVRPAPRRRRPAPGGSGGLSPRQLEVLDLLSAGATNASIAERLFISVRTAEHHVAAVMRILGVTSRAEAVRRAEADSIIGRGGADR